MRAWAVNSIINHSRGVQSDSQRIANESGQLRGSPCLCNTTHASMHLLPAIHDGQIVQTFCRARRCDRRLIIKDQ